MPAGLRWPCRWSRTTLSPTGMKARFVQSLHLPSLKEALAQFPFIRASGRVTGPCGLFAYEADRVMSSRPRNDRNNLTLSAGVRESCFPLCTEGRNLA